MCIIDVIDCAGREYQSCELGVKNYAGPHGNSICLAARILG